MIGIGVKRTSGGGGGGAATLTDKGAYIPGTYNKYDVVSELGKTYLSKVDNNTDYVTVTDSWELISATITNTATSTYINNLAESLATGYECQSGRAYTAEWLKEGAGISVLIEQYESARTLGLPTVDVILLDKTSATAVPVADLLTDIKELIDNLANLGSHI